MVGIIRRGKQAHAGIFGKLSQLIDGGLAYTTAMRSNRAQKCQVVNRIGNQFQIAQKVLNFLAGIELHPADDLIRYSGSDKCLFDWAAHGIDPVKDRNLARIYTGCDLLLDAVGQQASLGIFIFGHKKFHIRTFWSGGNQLLGLAAGIGGNQFIRAGQDFTAGSEIFFQLDYDGFRPVCFRTPEYCRIRPAPAVDGLDPDRRHADIAMGLRQQAGYLVLGVVGILVLVNQQILEPIAQFRAYLGIVAKQQSRFNQQIIKVQGIIFGQNRLILGIHFGGGFSEMVKGGGLEGIRIFKIVFQSRYKFQHP